MHQTEMLNLDDLVPAMHTYGTLNQLWSFTYAEQPLKKRVNTKPNEGLGLVRLFKCLLLPFMDNVSDREGEGFIQEHNAAKWFCGFSLSDETPDHTVFCNARQRIGTATVSKICADLRNQLKSVGLMSEVVTFVDAAHLISKATLWQERDTAIEAKQDNLHNEVLRKVAFDKEARIGCKGNDTCW